MTTIILMAVCFLAGVYSYKYRDKIKELLKKIFRKDSK